MIIHELHYYCTSCDRTHKIRVNSTSENINMSGVSPSIECNNTSKCKTAKLSLINVNKKEGNKKGNQLLG